MALIKISKSKKKVAGAVQKPKRKDKSQSKRANSKQQQGRIAKFEPEEKGNPTHREDFDKALQMLIPRVEPKGIKSNKLLED